MSERIRLGFWDRLCQEVLYYAGAGHGLLCGPPRSGKFRDIIVPLLLTFMGSMFIIDPRGEAACVTARYRRDVLGHEIYLLNPFNIWPQYLSGFFHAQYDCVGAKLDPESRTFASDADTLAEGWLPHLSQHEHHFVDSARLLVSGVAMHLRETTEYHSLPDVFTTVTGHHLYKFCEDAVTNGASEHVISRLSRFVGAGAMDSREIRAIVSAAVTGLGWVGCEPMAENLRQTTVDFNQMRARKMTVYVILPGQYMKTYAPWMRTITNAWADACLDEKNL
jgi:type IV secretion system protein VirD4